MASLGSFRAAAQELDPGVDPDTFDFYDETFTVVGIIPALIELEISAGLHGKISGIQHDAAMYEALRHALTIPARDVDGKTTPADTSQWEKFRGVAINRTASGDVLVSLVLNLLAAQLGRPTVQRSTSSAGPLPTSTNSNSSSSDTPDARTLRPVDEVLGG